MSGKQYNYTIMYMYIHVRVMSRGGVFLTFRVGQRSYMKLLRGRGTGI